MISRMEDLQAMPRRIGKRKPSVHKGEVYECTKGSKLIVLDYFDGDNVLIKFLDGFGHEKLTTADSIRKGLVKNPYDRALCGVGYVGEGPYIKGKAYTIWAGIISRCYDESQRDRSPSYFDCLVDERWHNFQTFAEWFYTNPYYKIGWALDKDVMYYGNREYSPDKCAFIPQELNRVLVNCRGKVDLGITWVEEKNDWCAKIARSGKVYNLGHFKEKSDALTTYKLAKEAHVKMLAEKWKGQIDDKIYKSLINFTIVDGSILQ